MTRKSLLGNLIRGLFTGLPVKRQKVRQTSAQHLKLLELESRVVPASATFTNNILTINLASGDYFDYFNEFRDTANNNALTPTSGYFKLSRWSSTTNKFEPWSWDNFSDPTGTWKSIQVGEGKTNDSIQLAAGKIIDGISIVVKGSSGQDGAYFRANPAQKDGVFTGSVETDSNVDDTVVQDYPFASQGDVRFLGTSVSAYADITTTKNLTISSNVGYLYVEGSRVLGAGGKGYSLAVNGTIEGATDGSAGKPSNRALLKNPGAPVTLGAGFGSYITQGFALDGVEAEGDSISLRGTFHQTLDFIKFHAPVTLENTAKIVVNNELLLEQGITSGATPRTLQLFVNGGAIATVNPLPNKATAQFSNLELLPVAGSEGAKVIWGGSAKTTSTTGTTIKLSVPTYLNGDVKLETSGNSTTDLAATGSIQSNDAANTSKLDIKTLQMTVSGKIGDETPLGGFSLLGSLKTLHDLVLAGSGCWFLEKTPGPVPDSGFPPPHSSTRASSPSSPAPRTRPPSPTRPIPGFEIYC
ncbi:MAG: hypothetical protein ACKOS8_17055, partial [Gemmataceae bacterium]